MSPDFGSPAVTARTMFNKVSFTLVAVSLLVTATARAQTVMASPAPSRLINDAQLTTMITEVEKQDKQSTYAR
jgi:hypothetical protein